MSRFRSRSADAVPAGAWPAQRGPDPALAPRKWRLAWRLIALVAIPTMLGLVLTGLWVTDSVRSAQAYGQVTRFGVLDQEVNGLAQAMEEERADTAAFIVAGRPAAGLRGLHQQYVITDGRAASVRRLVRQFGRDYPAATQAGTATVLASIAELPGLRRQAAQGQSTPLAAINGYSAATAGLFPVNDGLADLSGNPALITSVAALGSLSRMTDEAAQQQAILSTALAQGRFAPGARTALITAQAQQASNLGSFRSSATPEESGALTDTLAGPLAAAAQAVEQRATAAGPGALALGAQAGQQWGAGMSFTVGWMRHADQQLGTWITGDAQAQQRSAMRSAMVTGGVALAVLVAVLLATMIVAGSLVRPLRRLEAAALPPPAGEITRMAGAFDQAHREAWRLAGEEARRRRSIGAVSGSFFRRSHSLLERLLRLIDVLELSEDDPGRLASLFQIDHLVTRMRRHSDSALVLAGHETPRAVAEPVTLVDVLRAAVSEIEQYGRVVLDVQPGVSVRGSAVPDTVHLLAELLENATEFSPRTTQVIVSAHPARAGSLISITDGGTGLPEEHLRQLNWQLAHPSAADAAVTRHMGLFAVAHLAARHGITVALEQPPDGGTTAEVYLPAALISADARPPSRPGQAGEAPATPAAPGTRAWPEPGQPERDRGLPIFESVESDYPLTLRRELLQRSGPPARLPQRARQASPGPAAAAGQEARPAAPAESAEITREQLASFQRGSRRARAVERADPDPGQRARER